MGYARTEASAKRRVAMKRAIRRLGVDVKSDVTTKNLEKMYRKHLGKAPPSIEKYR